MRRNGFIGFTLSRFRDKQAGEEGEVDQKLGCLKEIDEEHEECLKNSLNMEGRVVIENRLRVD